jgi:hypothetical protein
MRPVSAALPSEPLFRRRSTRSRWAIALAAVSFVSGLVARGQVSADQIERARSEVAVSKNWIADRVMALRGMIVMGSHSSPPPNSAPSVGATQPKVANTQTQASHPGSQGPQPTTAPPEVNVLSLPIAPPAVAPKPIARAPIAAAPPAVPVRARSAPVPAASDNAEAAVEPAPRAPEPPRVAAPAAAPAANATPIAPGSLEDLIRKEVEKEQKKAR